MAGALLFTGKIASLPTATVGTTATTISPPVTDTGEVGARWYTVSFSNSGGTDRLVTLYLDDDPIGAFLVAAYAGNDDAGNPGNPVAPHSVPDDPLAAGLVRKDGNGDLYLEHEEGKVLKASVDAGTDVSAMVIGNIYIAA